MGINRIKKNDQRGRNITIQYNVTQIFKFFFICLSHHHIQKQVQKQPNAPLTNFTLTNI